MDVVEPAVVVTGGKPEVRRAASVSETSMPVAVPVPVAVAQVTLAHRAQYAALRVALALAWLAPVRLITATGAGLAWLIGPWLRQNRRALGNLGIAFPDKTDAERRRIARAMWANMGRIFAETLIFDRIATSDRIQFTKLEVWESRFRESGASIGCSLHMGNWEFSGWAYAYFKRNPIGVYKPLGNPLIDRWLVATRRHIFSGGLLGKGEEDARAGQHTARQLINMARKGGSIGFVSDHVDRRADPIPFMGRQARFTTAPAMIARHVGARFWVGRCLRVGKGSYFHMEMRELDVPRSQDKAADARALTAAKFAVYEAWIREAPEQWMWWNTRWVQPSVDTEPSNAAPAAASRSAPAR